MGDAPQVYVADRSAWRTWLTEHAALSSGIWLVYDKGPHRRLGYDDIVEEALCFGWVDSRPRRLDDARAMLYLAPRNPRSNWSRVNKQRVERLIAAGAMTPAGLAVVEAARASGRWSALDRVEDGVEPDDLAAALDADARARREWNGFPPSARRAILEWVDAARRPDTRARRVASVVEEAAQGRRANQWRQPARSPLRPRGSQVDMSMAQPFQPNLPTRDDGIPAADPGNGAPPPAEGFGVGGEEPDAPEQDADDSSAPPASDTPFRTPDPSEVGVHSQQD